MTKAPRAVSVTRATTPLRSLIFSLVRSMPFWFLVFGPGSLNSTSRSFAILLAASAKFLCAIGAAATTLLIVLIGDSGTHFASRTFLVLSVPHALTPGLKFLTGVGLLAGPSINLLEWSCGLNSGL